MTGISCKAESEGYKAAVTTPAEVRVPDYGYASRPISASCTAPGYFNGFKNVTTYNKTEGERLSAASEGGLLGLVIMAAVNAMSDERKHEFAYPDIEVTMNRLGCEKTKGGCQP